MVGTYKEEKKFLEKLKKLGVAKVAIDWQIEQVKKAYRKMKKAFYWGRKKGHI